MRLKYYSLKRCYLVFFVLGLAVSKTGLSASAFSFHLDVAVWAENNRLFSGFCRDAALGCDSLPVLSQLGLPDQQLPIDHENGRQIFLADFGDLAGGVNSTDNPGFQGLSGWLPSNTLISYRAVDSLQRWNPDTQNWNATQPGEAQIRLFGGLSTETVLSTDTSHCDGLLICIPKETTETIFNEASTVFTGQGIEAASSLIIDNTTESGALHAHLDWFLESGNNDDEGAYLLAMQFIADGYQESDPFYVMFNHGLSAANLAKAIQMRVNPDATLVPIPAALPLFMSAIAVVGLFQRSNRCCQNG